MARVADVHTDLDGSGGGADWAAPSIDEVTVLVTGYGPFLDQFPVNSSWSIASSLPARLDPTPTCPTPIRLVVPNQYLKVAYHPVIAAVPTLLSDEYSDPSPDIILHIGMASGRTYYTLETTAYRDGYDRLKDVEGMTFSKEENEEIWGECPPVLQPGWDVDDVWRRWRGDVRGHLDLRPSTDPGNFLCGFIYYASLSTLWKANRKSEQEEGVLGEGGPVRADGETSNVHVQDGERTSTKWPKKCVMFLHVPDTDKMGDVSNGVEVAEGMIRALVESRRRGLCGDVVDGSHTIGGKKAQRKERDLKKMC
ncbi:peptidase C15, pyroglutamyl peptidase I-like protein [Rhizodiscina lignyota]|uniref:Peptidase C15, pyroglutamyl peptidase I-like protein n=1 Tax=Rhizodiscina lignyota TaxID=1504668 RepID=A0A9P4I847_9PEZI|nr:peptidase C15, pyroglutamyl peptidase I-like protein [Rhizodiscina lignyota]